MEVGFLGLGVMGTPMAINLVRSGVRLWVWNRTRGKSEVLRRLGAEVAATPGELFANTQMIFLMLANEKACDHPHLCRSKRPTSPGCVVPTTSPACAWRAFRSRLPMWSAHYLNAKRY
jgi:3-hydroxyisobutyrate dehydrogenase-like beta-hydroxyacid dehydrogenase